MLKGTAGAASGTVIFMVPGNVDWAILLTSTITDTNVADPNASIPSADIYFNGMFKETTDSGNKDADDHRYVIGPQDRFEVRWSGGDPGVIATANLQVAQYAAGAAPAE